MKRTCIALVGVFAATIVLIFILPLETAPRNVGWHHYALVVCFFGSAVSSLLLLRYANVMGKLFGLLYMSIMALMGTVTLIDLMHLLTQDVSGLR